MRTVLGVDAGTTGVTALLVGPDARPRAGGYAEFPQHFPRPGWVEHHPEEIWAALLGACGEALSTAPRGSTVDAVGVTNQRETAVLWRRRDLTAPRPAIVWQDRRAESVCARRRAAGHEPRVAELTGLRLDPYFTAPSLTWLAEHEPAPWAEVESGDVVVGTVDSYVVARMSAGAAICTDHSNASRTLLYDLARGNWSAELADLFGVPLQALPRLVPSSGALAHTDPDAFLGLDVPVAGIAGDQQAALFGQGCLEPGRGKCTYGTGSFVLVNTGEEPVTAEHGLLATVAWQLGDQARVFALEGAVFVTGAAVQWLRDGLGLISAASEVETLAASVPDSAGVVFVPALTGLGAPEWDAGARGALFGLTRGTNRGHLARATLEAIAYEVRDVVDAFGRAGVVVAELAVDGGASANNLLCQLQADQLGVPVRRAAVRETTALGAALLAGLGSGLWSGPDELAATIASDRLFAPTPGRRDDGHHQRWREAVRRSLRWEG